jgi:CRISPR-associated exonuclease Cas4
MTTGTQIHYYHLCKRKLWLFSNGVQMEQDSTLVAEGKFIHETTYGQRANKHKELDFGYVKIDHYDAQKKVIHEVKKSSKLEFVHIAQLKYYLYVMRENSINNVTGILEYPKQRKTLKVLLTDEDVEQIKLWELDVKAIISQEKCPDAIRKPYCKSCAYYEFCFI